MLASIELQPGARVKCNKLTAVKQYCGAARGTGGGNEQWVTYAREIPRGSRIGGQSGHAGTDHNNQCVISILRDVATRHQAASNEYIWGVLPNRLTIGQQGDRTETETINREGK